MHAFEVFYILVEDIAIPSVGTPERERVASIHGLHNLTNWNVYVWWRSFPVFWLEGKLLSSP